MATEAQRILGRIRDRRRADSLKESAVNMYSNGDAVCKRCGIGDIDVLCLDHIANDGKAHRAANNVTSGSKFYRWLRHNDYPSGFQVLCFNCNMKKEREYRRGN